MTNQPSPYREAGIKFRARPGLKKNQRVKKSKKK